MVTQNLLQRLHIVKYNKTHAILIIVKGLD